MSCVDVKVVVPNSFWTVDPVEISLVVVFGILVGIVIAVLVARCFFQELAKDRIQQSEQKDWTNSGMYEKRISYVPLGEVPLTEVYNEDESPVSTGNRRRSSSASARAFRSQATIDSYDVDKTEEEDVCCCLITALTKTSRMKTQTELSLQDYRETQKLEEQLHQEKTSVFLQLLRIILSKFVAKERLDEQYAEQFVEKYTESVESAVQTVMSEQSAVEEEVRQKPGLSQDPLALEEALEKTRPESTRKMGRILQDAQLKIQDDLAKETDLSDEEIDAVVEKLTENMAEVERMLGEEAARQNAILQERLERRRALAQQYSEIKVKEESGNQTRMADLCDTMDDLVDGKQLLEEQSKSIMKQFEADLVQIQVNHDAEVMNQSLRLSEKLRKFREKKLRKLEKQQEDEIKDLTQAASKAVNISDFVQAHHGLLEQHRDKRNTLMDELDHQEAEEVLTLRQQLEQSREESIANQEESLFEILAERARLSEREAGKIMKRHVANVNAAQEKQEDLRKQQQAEIEERLAKRKALWEEDQQRQEAEQRQLAAQQSKTVSRLLDTQSGLDEEARRQILLQHEQNTLAVNNQLQMSKMKQHKLLEARLAQRRARMELLKEKQEEELEMAKSDRQVAELKEQHEEEVATEMKAMEQAKAELRSRLAQETKEALIAQDEQLGALIGKLQVGQARRQGIIKKQDKAIKELQDQLVDSVVGNQTMSEHQTDRIIKRHMREIEEVEEKLQEARAHQAKVLQDKYEAKKLLKEKTFVAQLEEEKKEMARSQSVQIKKSALGIMSQMLLETRHKQAMSKLRQEMKRELAEQKDQLNQQLERAMIEELQEQEKNFLGQLAAASEMSRDDLKDLVNTAVTDRGGDSRDVGKLSKDLTQRVKSAKAQANDEEEEEEEEEEGDKPSRRKKGRGKRR